MSHFTKAKNLTEMKKLRDLKETKEYRKKGPLRKLLNINNTKVTTMGYRECHLLLQKRSQME